LISINGFFYYWGVFSILTSLIILVFKHEENTDTGTQLAMSEIYKISFKFFTLPHFRKYVGILLFSKLPFFVADNIAPLVLIAKGFDRSIIGLISL
jgi:hypothetical protein